MQCPDQDPIRFRQPKVLPFSASWRCYPGNLGQGHRISVFLPVSLSIPDHPECFGPSAGGGLLPSESFQKNLEFGGQMETRMT